MDVFFCSPAGLGPEMNHEVRFSLIHHGSVTLPYLGEQAMYGLAVVDCIINAVVKLSAGIRNLINKFAILLVTMGVFLPIVSQQFFPVIGFHVKYCLELLLIRAMCTPRAALKFLSLSFILVLEVFYSIFCIVLTPTEKYLPVVSEIPWGVSHILILLHHERSCKYKIQYCKVVGTSSGISKIQI